MKCIYRFVRLVQACLLGAALLLVARPASADATLFMGFGAGTVCAMGCAGHPNTHSGGELSEHFSIFQNKNGAGGNITNPILLILAIPHVTDAAFFDANSIINVTSYNPYPSGTPNSANTWNYGSSYYGIGGYAGYYDASAGTDVYNFLGLANAGSSNNFANWSSGYNYTNPATVGWGLYTFELNVTLGSKGLVDIQFGGADADKGVNHIPAGSYVLSYSWDKNKRYFSTPYTQIALQMPEPAAVLLVGSGLLLVGRLCRRKPGAPRTPI